MARKHKTRKSLHSHIFSPGGNLGLPQVQNNLNQQVTYGGSSVRRPTFETIAKVDSPIMDTARAQNSPGLAKPSVDSFINKGGNSGGNFLSTASQIGGYASMFDSIAQGISTGIDAGRSGVSEQPKEVVEGVLGSQSGSHLSAMWTTDAKTRDAINSIRKRGEVDYGITDNANLMAQYASTGNIRESNINTKGKEFQDFVFDPASYIITSLFGKRKSASQRQAEINRAIRNANIRREEAFAQAVEASDKQREANMMYNFSAFGGPIYNFMEGPSSYDIAKDNAFAKQLNAQMKGIEAFNSLPSGILAEGGRIHIAPSKRGTFTAAATKHGKSVQEFASQVLANPDNYSSAMVKKANFARNAAKWHANGGLLSNNFTNGVTLVNEGGTHENNPHEGVMMGIAPDGKPNLVEEGEAIFDNYVFSNRLKVPKAVRNKYKLRGPKDMTFAEAFRKAQKESEERPNDPISQDGLENIAMILARTQEAIRGSKNSRVHKAPYGGTISKKDQAYIDSMDEEVYEPDVQAAIVDFWNNRVPEDKTTHNTVPARTSINRVAVPLTQLGAVIGDITGITNNPYTYNEIPSYQAVDANLISNYIPETHFDTRYAANQNAQQAAATRNAIMQSSAPSRNAALLASDFNAQIANGELLRQAALDEYNRMVEREKFNSSINQANSELGLRAAMANQEAKLRYGQAALQQARMNVDETNMTMAAKAQNLGNFAESLDDMIREEDARNWRDWYIMSQGRGMDLEGIKTNITPSKQYQYAKSLGYTDKEIEAAGIRKAAYGGKLKRKKGLTY